MDLKQHAVRYDLADVRAWQAGKYELLTRSRASEFIKQILAEKAARRRRARLAAGRPGDRRFFGQAFVAANPAFAHRAGWYGSFQWLSVPAWCASHPPPAPGYPARFREALNTYVLNLRDTQSREAILRSLLGGTRAAAPDLWLFTGSEHRFIEVKLPGDRVRDSQLAGLALIARCLKTAHPASVEVVSLVDGDATSGGLSDEERARFTHFREALTSLCGTGKRRRKEWRWNEATVDRRREHIELRCDASRAESEEWVQVALVGRPVRGVFPVQWMRDPDDHFAANVRRELDFYLVEHPAEYPDTGDPWDYAVYHCGTAANLYSNVHWSHFAAKDG